MQSSDALPSCTSTLTPWARAHLLQDLADGFVLIHLLPRQNLLEPLVHFSHAARKTTNSFTLSTFFEHLLCAGHLGGDQHTPFIHSTTLMEHWLGTVFQAGCRQGLSESRGPGQKGTKPLSQELGDMVSGSSHPPLHRNTAPSEPRGPRESCPSWALTLALPAAAFLTPAGGLFSVPRTGPVILAQKSKPHVCPHFGTTWVLSLFVSS